MKKRLIFGLEARLFALIFLVASFISLGVAVYIYDQEKDLTEQALADELLRAAHVFAASLNPDDVAQLPYEAPNSSLVQQYRNLAQRIVDEAGVVYAYTCSPSGTGRCRFGVVSNDLVTGDVYAYSETFAAEAWEAVLSGEAAVSPIFRDEYGEWMSALDPYGMPADAWLPWPVLTSKRLTSAKLCRSRCAKYGFLAYPWLSFG